MDNPYTEDKLKKKSSGMQYWQFLEKNFSF